MPVFTFDHLPGARLEQMFDFQLKNLLAWLDAVIDNSGMLAESYKYA